MTDDKSAGRPYKVRRTLASVALPCCVIGSGAAALIYQVVWNRFLVTVFGSTTAATTAVVAAFMVGLALGSASLARYEASLRRPWLAYAVLELFIAAYALALPHLLSLSQPLYQGLWQQSVEMPLALNGLRLTLSILLLLLPTAAMGATLPLFVRISSRIHDNAAVSVVAKVYGFNSLGGVIGACAAGFVLIPHMGMTATYLSAITLGLLMALIVTFIGNTRTAGTPDHLYDKPASNSISTCAPTLGWLLPSILLLSGVAALGYEVIWTRMLVLIIGSSTYAFSLMLALYIAGLSLGSLWMSQRAEGLRSVPITFAHLQLGIAVSVVAGLWVYGKLPSMLLDWYREWGLSFGSSLAAHVALAALVIVPPTFLLGAAFPLAVGLMGGTKSIAAKTAQAYAWLTAGNVIGALLAGGLLIGWFGLQTSLIGFAVVSASAGLAMLILAPQRGRMQTMPLGLMLVAAMVGFAPRWDSVVLTSGVYQEAALYLGLIGKDRKLSNLLSGYRPVFYREGSQAVVSVVERPTLKDEPHRVLAIDGKVDASNGADMSTQVLSAHIPLLLHAAPNNVLLIGLASGVTAGSIVQHESVQQLTVAEIEPAVVAAAKAFATDNHNVLQHKNLNLVLDDGYHFLSMHPQLFDVIISEPSNPWLSGPARLFTEEFFVQVSDRLTDIGVFAQWLPLYGLSSPLLKTEVRTFLGVFPHAAVFQVSQGDLLLIGSRSPLYPRQPAVITEKIEQDLARIDEGEYSLWARFLAGHRGLLAWVGDGPRNTQDNGLLEFGSPRYLLADTLAINQASVNNIPWQADLRDWAKDASDDWHLGVAEANLKRELWDRAEYLAAPYIKTARAKAVLAEAAAARGHWISAQQYWKDADTPQGNISLAKIALEDGRYREVLAYLERLPRCCLYGQRGSSEAEFLRLSAQLVLGVETVMPYNGDAAMKTPDQWQLLALYLRSVSAQRIGQSADAQQWLARFHVQLDGLRRQLERENAGAVMDGLLQQAPQLHGLNDTEQQRLKAALMERLVTPFSHYLRGVSLLWLGDHRQAKARLQAYLQQLPEQDPASHAWQLLSQMSEEAISIPPSAVF